VIKRQQQAQLAVICLLLGYQDIEVVNDGEIKTKIVYLVKGRPTNAQLQYNGIWSMGRSIAKINYDGNPSSP